VLLFVLEFILAIVVLGVVAIVATIIGHQWTCVITSPEGPVFRLRARGMRGVRRLRHATAAAIKAGDFSALERAKERESRAPRIDAWRQRAPTRRLSTGEDPRRPEP
jgi:hypothetical protein